MSSAGDPARDFGQPDADLDPERLDPEHVAPEPVPDAARTEPGLLGESDATGDPAGDDEDDDDADSGVSPREL